jgi:hypothetical protein
MFIILYIISFVLVLVGFGGVLWGRDTLPGMSCMASGIILSLMVAFMHQSSI